MNNTTKIGCWIGRCKLIRTRADIRAYQFVPTSLLSTVLSIILFAFSCAGVNAAPPSEYEIKTAFVHNIAKFVEWPAVSNAGDKLMLCILGDSPFTKAATSLAGKQINGLVWEVRTVDSQAALRDCRVLFIAASESDNLPGIIQRIGDRAILTMGDSDRYAERGVMVNFYLEQSRVRFEINLDAVVRSRFKISPQLLNLARIVHESGGNK